MTRSTSVKVSGRNTDIFESSSVRETGGPE